MSDPAISQYDVAFSFLTPDLRLAEALALELGPAMSVFVYSRQKETLLGGDGMDQFAAVFDGGSRLTVVLYRDGWGHTPWTAFEESHIKSRALATRMTSFLIVRLDNAQLPRWVPDTHLYASTSTETNSDILAVIRVRARQQGVTLRTETTQELALRLARAREAKERREVRQQSYAATREVQDEVKTLFAEIVRHVSEVKAVTPGIDLASGANASECGIAGSNGSVSVAWLQPWDNVLSNARLRVNYWKGLIRVPGTQVATVAGAGWDHASHYLPELSEDDQWVWRYAPSLDDFGEAEESIVIFGGGEDVTYSSSELADRIVREHLSRTLE